jgi:hypothetical protein
MQGLLSASRRASANASNWAIARLQLYPRGISQTRKAGKPDRMIFCAERQNGSFRNESVFDNMLAS